MVNPIVLANAIIAPLLHITLFVQLVEFLVRQQKRRQKCRKGATTGHHRPRNTSMDALRNEYKSLFARAYRMNYPAFVKLLETIRDRLELSPKG